MLKVCNKCKFEKETTEFYASRASRNVHGVQSSCKECSKKHSIEYAKKNPDKIKIWKKNDYEKHFDKRSVKKEERRLLNPDSVRTSAARSHRRHRSEMTNYYIGKLIRHRFWLALQDQGGNKERSVLSMLGCTIEQAKSHIAAKFSCGMSWDNYGDWEIDHIRPCASFDLKIIEQQGLCFHYTNLQPLWKKKNRSKGARVQDDARL